MNKRISCKEPKFSNRKQMRKWKRIKERDSCCCSINFVLCLHLFSLLNRHYCRCDTNKWMHSLQNSSQNAFWVRRYWSGTLVHWKLLSKKCQLAPFNSTDEVLFNADYGGGNMNQRNILKQQLQANGKQIAEKSSKQSQLSVNNCQLIASLCNKWLLCKSP